MAPVVRHLATLGGFRVRTVLTAQHREMLDQVIGVFAIPVHHDLNVMTPAQSLASLTASLCERLARVLQDERPDCVLVQGDTTSTLVGALAGFYQQVPVAHLEAGLRTHHVRQPFPEEMNRRLVSALADFHFAPTESARQNLLAENISADRVWVTGNSGVDALRLISEREDLVPREDLAQALGRREGTLLAVTSHRRENLPFLSGIAAAIVELLDSDPTLHVVFPVHLSPAVRAAVFPVLHATPRCHLLDPLPYDQFVLLMKRADLILTDSGGIQEEAPYLGKPVLVMRRVTERPEAVEAGTVLLVGDDQSSIVDHTFRLLHDAETRRRMARAHNPYGDGHTAERVGEILREQLSLPDRGARP